MLLMKRKNNMSEIQRKNDFTTGPIFGPLVKFTLPILGALVLQSLYGAVDLMIVGKFAASADVSAVSTGTQIMHLITNTIAGLSMGTTVLMGQYLGAKRDEDARSMANQVFACAMIFALACVLVFEFATAPIVTWLGAEGNVWIYGRRYMQLVVIDMPFL